MKHLYFFIIQALVISISTFTVDAQQLDDAALDLSSKKLVEGAFSVYLADTVSPGFVEQTFIEMGIEIKDTHIHPVSVFFGRKPDAGIYNKMISHPYVSDVKVMSKADKQEFNFPDHYTEEQKKRALESLERINNRSPFHIVFKHHITPLLVDEYLSEFAEVNHAPVHPNQKYITVSCEKGQEEKLMDELEQLPFVESTAYIVASSAES